MVMGTAVMIVLVEKCRQSHYIGVRVMMATSALCVPFPWISMTVAYSMQLGKRVQRGGLVHDPTGDAGDGWPVVLRFQHRSGRRHRLYLHGRDRTVASHRHAHRRCTLRDRPS